MSSSGQLLGHEESKRALFATALLVLMLLQAISILYIAPAYAIPTWVEGHITKDTTWTLTGSPYRVVKDVVVDAGVTLTIEPGVRVEFADGSSLVVEGSLYAVGAADRIINFTSSRVDPFPGSWGTIKFIGSENELFKMNFCAVSFATQGVTIESLGRVVIEKSEFSNISGNGIQITGPSNIIVKDVVIKLCKNGISASGTSLKDIIVTASSIVSNRENGIYLHNPSIEPGYAYLFNVTISNNDISSNAKNGIYLHSLGYRRSYIHDVIIQSNNISLNGENGIRLHSQGEVHLWSGADLDGYSYIYNVKISKNNVLFNKENGVILYSYGDGYPFSGYAYIYDVVISENNISLNGGEGIYLHSSASGYYDAGYSYIHEVTISRNTVSSNMGNGIYIENLGERSADIYNLSMSKNSILSNAKSGIKVYSYNSYGPPHGSHSIANLTILENEVSFNGEDGMSFSTPFGQLRSFKIRANIAFLNGENGISIGSPSVGEYVRYLPDYMYYIVLSENKLSSNKKSGVSLIGRHYENVLFDILVQNNTISANNIGILILEDSSIKINITSNSISYNMIGVQFFESKDNLARYNDIYHNSYGMLISGGATVNAKHNYWGDVSGPYHPSLNPLGKGNPVNGDGKDLDFIPFSSNPFRRINERPLASLSISKKVDEASYQTILFDASNSTDDGRVIMYFFDFGDNVKSGWTTESLIEHTYTKVGNYTVRLTVMDDLGVASNATTTTITIGYIIEVRIPYANVTVGINGNNYTTNDAGRIHALVFRGNHTIWVQTLISISEETRAVFLSWDDGLALNPRTFSVKMDVFLLAKYKIQHHLTLLSTKGKPTGAGWYDEGSKVTVSAEHVTDVIMGKSRYILDSYLLDNERVNILRAESGTYKMDITMDAPHVIVFNYIPQYYLTVKSEYGEPEGEGWYDAGSIVTFSVKSPVGFIIQQVFTGWSGDSTATTTTATILMDGPKTVIANWRTDYTQLYAIITIAVVIAVATILVKRKK